MPRIPAALAVVVALGICLGFNIVRYPVVWEMAATVSAPAGSVSPLASAAGASPPSSGLPVAAYCTPDGVCHSAEDKPIELHARAKEAFAETPPAKPQTEKPVEAKIAPKYAAAAVTASIPATPPSPEAAAKPSQDHDAKRPEIGKTDAAKGSETGSRASAAEKADKDKSAAKKAEPGPKTPPASTETAKPPTPVKPDAKDSPIGEANAAAQGKFVAEEKAADQVAAEEPNLPRPRRRMVPIVRAGADPRSTERGIVERLPPTSRVMTVARTVPLPTPPKDWMPIYPTTGK